MDAQWLNGRFWMMRYASVESTTAILPKRRRRFEFFVASKWRLPACGRRTLPRAVILKRLATDFFVLMPLGRRIISQLSFEMSAQYRTVHVGSKRFFGLRTGPDVIPSFTVQPARDKTAACWSRWGRSRET